MSGDEEIIIGKEDVETVDLADVLGLKEEVKGPDPAVWGEDQLKPYVAPERDPWLESDRYVGLIVSDAPEVIEAEDLDLYIVKGPDR